MCGARVIIVVLGASLSVVLCLRHFLFHTIPVSCSFHDLVSLRLPFRLHFLSHDAAMVSPFRFLLVFFPHLVFLIVMLSTFPTHLYVLLAADRNIFKACDLSLNIMTTSTHLCCVDLRKQAVSA